MILDPRPLLVDTSDHAGKAFYGADDHLERLKVIKEDLKRLKSDFVALSLHTDNESTMRSLRKKWTDSTGSGGAGCGSHGINLVVEAYWEWSENKKIKGQITDLYQLCRNTKIRQALSHRRGGERRNGAPGGSDTRSWTTYSTMCSKLLELRDDLGVIAANRIWKPYIGRAELLLIHDVDDDFWPKVERMNAVISHLVSTIKGLEGYISLGKVYYAFLKLLERHHHFGGQQTEDDKFLCKALGQRFELIYGPDILEAFLLDARYRNEAGRIKVGGITYDERKFYVDLFERHRGDRGTYNKIVEQFVAFRGGDGKYAVDPADYPSDDGGPQGLNGKSPNKANRLYWKKLKVIYGNGRDADAMLLIQMGLDCTKKPCGIAAVESSFSPLKLIQTPTRAALSYKKLSKLLYIHCNYRYLRNFID